MDSDTRDGCLGLSMVAIAWVFGVLVVIVLSIGAWFFKVETSGIKGKGDQQVQVNSATNRSNWYHDFFQIKTGYESALKNITTAKEALAGFDKANKGASDPFGQLPAQRQQLVDDLSGARKLCQDDATEYNNKSGETTIGAQFKDSGLPSTLDVDVCSQ